MRCGYLSPPRSRARQLDLQEIVVSARRREESIQNVPISIAAFSEASLKDRQITTTQGLSEIAPNVQFSPVAPSSGNSSASAIFIRGVGQTDFIASTDPGVGFYVDGVYFARAAGTAIALVTNILSGRPLGGDNTFAVRVSALWKPTSSFDLLFQADDVSVDTPGTPTVFGGINTAAAFVGFAARDAGCPGYTSGQVPETVDPRCPNNQSNTNTKRTADSVSRAPVSTKSPAVGATTEDRDTTADHPNGDARRLLLS